MIEILTEDGEKLYGLYVEDTQHPGRIRMLIDGKLWFLQERFVINNRKEVDASYTGWGIVDEALENMGIIEPIICPKIKGNDFEHPVFTQTAFANGYLDASVPGLLEANEKARIY
jgi:hypothetical protein